MPRTSSMASSCVSGPRGTGCLTFHPRDLVEQLARGKATISQDRKYICIRPQALPNDNPYACRTGYSPQCKIPLVLHSKEGFEYLGFTEEVAEELMARWAEKDNGVRTPSPKNLPPFLLLAYTRMLNGVLSSDSWDLVRSADSPPESVTNSLNQPLQQPSPGPQEFSIGPVPGEAFGALPGDWENINVSNAGVQAGAQSGEALLQPNHLNMNFSPYPDFKLDIGPQGCPDFPMHQNIASQQQSYTSSQQSSLTAQTTDYVTCNTPKEFVFVIRKITGLREEAAWNAYHIFTNPELRSAGFMGQKDLTNNATLTIWILFDIILYQRYKLLLQIKAMSEWRAEQSKEWYPECPELKQFVNAIPRCVSLIPTCQNTAPMGILTLNIGKATRRLNQLLKSRLGEAPMKEREGDNSFASAYQWTPRPVNLYVKKMQSAGSEAKRSLVESLKDQDWEGINMGIFFDAVYVGQLAS